MLTLLIGSIYGVECADLPKWKVVCTDQLSGIIECPASGYFEVKCNLTTGELCSDRVAKIKCFPTEGKSRGTTLTLSIFLGFLGADRFYLGYPSIGILKLFTGGFFGLGWWADIFGIAIGVVKPARGGEYKFEEGPTFNLRVPFKQEL